MLPILKDIQMGLFDFIRNKKKERRTPETILKRLVYYMPDFYTTHPQFKNCSEYLAHHEWGLALESLMELVSETGHYFAKDFWTELAEAADKMGMKHEAALCKEQIDRNSRDLKFRLPLGSTVVKLDDNHFQHYTSAIIEASWASERRTKDDVLSMLNKDGVYMKSGGRCGFIYCVDKRRIAEIYFELGANGLILYFEQIADWEVPEKIKMTTDEKQKIKEQLIAWAQTTRNAIDLC